MVRLLVLGMVLLGLSGCVSEGPIYGYGGPRDFAPYPAPVGRVIVDRGPRYYDGPVYRRPPVYRDGLRYDRREARRERRLERRFYAGAGPRFERGRYDDRRSYRRGPYDRGPARYDRY